MKSVQTEIQALIGLKAFMFLPYIIVLSIYQELPFYATSNLFGLPAACASDVTKLVPDLIKRHSTRLLQSLLRDRDYPVVDR